MEITQTKEFQERLDLEKNYLVEIFTDKYEEYKNMITSRFSDFVDMVLDEELSIPDDDRIVEILKEAKTEILSLRNQVNELTGKNLDLLERNRELYSDCVEMATEIRDHRNNIKVNVELSNDDSLTYFDIEKFFKN